MRYEPLVYNTDFLRAYRRGKNLVHPHIVVYVRKTGTGRTRVGITCSKKVGKAVVRSRARRVIRNALYQVLEQDVGSYDLVFVSRGQTPRLKSHQLAATLRKLLPKAGIPVKPQKDT